MYDKKDQRIVNPLRVITELNKLLSRRDILKFFNKGGVMEELPTVVLNESELFGELSPKEPPSYCMSDNLLAAFSEGTLQAKDRRRVLAHLRKCNECMEVLIDAVELMDDLPEEIAHAELPLYYD